MNDSAFYANACGLSKIFNNRNIVNCVCLRQHCFVPYYVQSMSHLLQNFVILHLSLIYILLIIDTFKILYYFILITVILIVKFESLNCFSKRSKYWRTFY